ncbi:MAG: hypothetical protein K2O52_00340, partial [Oscillospiraceae bacterium]|nr:hypothetical protein [Oscillospiraceae bacterium]
YKEHLEMLSAMPEENDELPPPSEEIAGVGLDEAKNAILASAMASVEPKQETNSTFAHSMLEDFS